MRRAISLLAFALLPALSCGYHLGYEPRPGIRTVAIPVCENLSLRRELEFPLTRAIVLEVQRRTALEIVADAGAADAVLRVTLARFEEAVTIEGRNNAITQSSATIYVDVRVDAPGGGSLLGRSPAHIVEQAEFPAIAGARVAAVTPDAFREVAERVVMLLEAPIGAPTETSAPRSRPR